jgi:hypothetical protein
VSKLPRGPEELSSLSCVNSITSKSELIKHEHRSPRLRPSKRKTHNLVTDDVLALRMNDFRQLGNAERNRSS